jgi:GH25 family lysozyme M1 (1,4-beta-N-acetylmuramidase)
VIDVSKWQTQVNWAFVQEREVAGAMIRGLNGVWEDSLFKSHWALSRLAGVPRGAYAYYLDSQDPKLQAKKLFDLLSSTGDLGELPPALDIEEINNPTLTASKIKICLEEIERLFQRTPMVYTRASVWNPKIGNVTWASRYPLWVAHYTLVGWQPEHIARTVTDTAPSLPSPWSEFMLWQITDKCPAANYGVSGYTVDLNVAQSDVLASLMGEPPTVGDQPGVQPGMAKVLVQGLNLRSRPRLETNIVASLNYGEIVGLLDTYQEDDVNLWRLVMRTDRRAGWAAEWNRVLVNRETGKLVRGLEVSA